MRAPHVPQKRVALGFDTGSVDGRIGLATTIAVQKFQRKIGIEPADGYPGIGLLNRLRRGS